MKRKNTNKGIAKAKVKVKVKTKGVVGFTYTFEIVGTDGKVRKTWEDDNIIPDVGRDYMLTAALLGGTQISSWFFGLYGTAHTPAAGDTMVSLLAAVTEITAYSSATRPAIVPDALSGGVYSNVATKIEYTMTSAVTIYGGFMTSNSVKSSTTGTLLSVEAPASAVSVASGEILRVTAGLALATA